MAILDILTIPDKRLKHKSVEVKEIDGKLLKFVDDMYETLYETGNGIGLAAPQVNVLKRVVVIDIKENEKSNKMTLINPKITMKSSEKCSHQEGCLSIPEYYAEVVRAKYIQFEFTNIDGKQIKSEAEGLLSICIQHELDHLDGILFIDHISSLKRKLVIQKFSKFKKKQKNGIVNKNE